MNSQSMLHGIIDLYTACNPDSDGLIMMEQLRRELGTRMPEYKVDNLFKVLPIGRDRSLSFIDFWALMDVTMADGSSQQDQDDLKCLRYLRDEVLREFQRSGNGKLIRHDRLVAILGQVRDQAVNKSTWNDAIRSTGNSGSSSNRNHSATTISAAIKVMLEEYLKGDEIVPVSPNPVKSNSNVVVPVLPPTIGTPEASQLVSVKEDELHAEIDSLRSLLTESECRASLAIDESKRSMEQLTQQQIVFDALKASESALREELARVTEAGKLVDATGTSDKASLATTTKDLDEAREEIMRLKQTVASYKWEISALKTRVACLQGPNSQPRPTTVHVETTAGLPTLQEWERVRGELEELKTRDDSAKSKSHSAMIESLHSQIQTLEVQKNDADAEITRLRTALHESHPSLPVTPSGRSSRAPSIIASTATKRRNTVNVNGFSLPPSLATSAPNPLAADFINVPTRSGSSSERNSKRRSSSSRRPRMSEQRCVQQ